MADKGNTQLQEEGLREFIASQKAISKRQYDRNVNMDLSRQNSQQLFKRNIEVVLNQAYAALQGELQTRLDGGAYAQADNADLIKPVLADFEELIDELMEYALKKHRSSCALSNFPDEHNPSREYIAEVISQVSRGWSGFVAQLNSMLAA